METARQVNAFEIDRIDRLNQLSQVEMIRARKRLSQRDSKLNKAVVQFMYKAMNGESLRLRVAAIWFFFNYYLWTYDPRRRPHDFPFILWEYQKDFLEKIEEAYMLQEDILVEKSRDMGATWMMLGWGVIHFLFEKNFNMHIISKKEEDVDDGTIATIFPKIKYMLRKLPRWMIPEFNEKKHMFHMKLIHWRNNNTITGESANPDAGRSRRYNIVFLDEFAKNPNDDTIWMTLADTTPVRIPVSTPAGMGNKFAKLRHSGQIRVIRLHWKQHPLKDEEWYRRECERRTSFEVAQELDISYRGSKAGKVYGEFDYDKHVKKVEYDPELPLYIAWDFGIGDATAILWIQTLRDEVRIIDAFEDRDKPIDYYVPIVLGEIPRTENGRWPYAYSLEASSKINEHRLWKHGIHFGDVDCRKREKSTGKSVYSELRKYGIVVRSRRVTIDQRVNAVKKILKGKFVLSDKLMWVAECFENYHWPTDGAGNVKYTGGSVKPVHDEFSHTMTAFEYFAVNWRPGIGFDVPDNIPANIVYTGNSVFGY